MSRRVELRDRSSMRDGVKRNIRRRGGGFGSSRIATSTTASGDEAMEMENRTRMWKRPNSANTLVDDEGVDEPWVSDDEGYYLQEESVVTVSVSTPIGSSSAN